METICIHQQKTIVSNEDVPADRVQALEDLVHQFVLDGVRLEFFQCLHMTLINSTVVIGGKGDISADPSQPLVDIVFDLGSVSEGNIIW